MVDGRCSIFVSMVQWIDRTAAVEAAGDVAGDVCMCYTVYLLAIIQIINRK